MEKLGFPGSKPLKRILEHLMTPEEARVAAALPGSVDEVAEKLSMERSRVKDVLESLFRKGVAIPRDFKERSYFRLARNIVQLHDATLASKHMRDPEYAVLWKEFGEREAYKAVGEFFAATGIKFGRVVPAYNAIKDLPGVLPCENIYEMMRAQKKIAVVPCSCRNVTRLAGDGCRYTKELVEDERTWKCVQVGRGPSTS